MKWREIRTGPVVVALVLIVCVGSSIFGQKSQPQYPKKTQVRDRVEEAHRGMLQGQRNQATEAGKLTDEVAAKLPNTGRTAGKIPRKNLIDEHIFSRIERDRIPHAGLSSDEEFIRRVYIDATGLVPTADAVRKFSTDTDPEKRAKLIDSLIGNEEFAEQWALFWGDLFRAGYSIPNTTFQEWIKEWMRSDRPYNEVVHDMLVPVAKNHGTIPSAVLFGYATFTTMKADGGPVSPDDYTTINRLDMLDEVNTEIGRIFLGINNNCISCHDGAGHLDSIDLFLTDKTRRDFFRQSAFMGRTRILAAWDEKIKNNDAYWMVIDDLGKGYDTENDGEFYSKSEIRVPRDGRTYTPAFLLTGEEPQPGRNPRAELARMLTSHVQFSRATVNLIWGKLMTVAFVTPYNGFDLNRLDPKNPPPKPWTVQPTNPELLEALAQDFRANNFSIHHLMKTIMKSSAYQLSSRFDGEWKESYTAYYPRKYIRVLTGGEAVDSITQVTGRPAQFDNDGERYARFKQLNNPSAIRSSRTPDSRPVQNLVTSFFQTFRRSDTTGNRASTLQALLLMSSDFVNDRVLAANGSTVQQLVESSKSNAEVIEELYLTALARWPTRAEKETTLQDLNKDRKSGTEDLMWALLNGIEFIVNH